MHERAPVSKETDLPPSLQTAHIESSLSLRHVCQRAKQVGQHVNCVYSFIPAPFLLALFSPQLFCNNWRCEENSWTRTAHGRFWSQDRGNGAGMLFSFIFWFLMNFRSLISLSVKCSTALYLFIYPIYFYPFLLVPSEAR